MRARSIVAFLSVAATLVFTLPAHSNLLVNGSFETGPFMAVGVGDVNLCPGDTHITGWVVTRGALDFCGGPPVTHLWDCEDGVRSLDLDGSAPCNFDITGGIAQTFATTPGTCYLVSFWLAGNPGGSPAVKTIHVTAAGQDLVLNFNVTGHSFSNMGWENHTWDFAATSASTTLEFYSDGTSRGYGPTLDNVSVVLDPDQAKCSTPARTVSWGSIKIIYR